MLGFLVLSTDVRTTELNPDEDKSMMEEDGDQLLYSGAKINLGESMLLILSFVVRHSLSNSCLTDLLTLIAVHCPVPNICKTSLYHFRKFFHSDRLPLKFCKYCTTWATVCLLQMQFWFAELVSIFCSNTLRFANSKFVQKIQFSQ